MGDKRKSPTQNRMTRTDRRERQAKLEAMRREQRAKERRKTLLYVGVAVLLGLALVAAAALPAIRASLNDPTKKDPTAFGVALSAASCDPEIVEATQGGQDHVEPGVRVDYANAPPSSGRHDGETLLDPQPFYAAGTAPPVEKLVHSLEHGYTVIWYDDTVTGDAQEALRGLAQRLRVEPAAAQKVIVAPWPGAADNRPALPEGKHVAFSHWGATQGFRQYCGAVSGEAAAGFVRQHPAADSPEPRGA